jgi:DNA adenine methylase
LTSSPELAIVASMSYYPGGKGGQGVFQSLINLMPPHDVYIEPFLGSGAVMRNKRPARLNIGLDLDPHAVRMALSPAFAPQLPAEASIVGIAEVRSLLAGTGERRRRAPVFAMVAAAPGENGGMRSTEASSGENGACSRIVLASGDALSFLRDAQLGGAELVYCDPPYIGSTRSERFRKLYEHELATEEEHGRLLTILKRLPCRVMISGYWSTLYAEALAGWNHVQFGGISRGGKTTEHVWFNYPRPVELHDYRHIGSNCRERENLKRKIRRWTGKLQRMPLLERQALLSAISTTGISSEATRS